MRGLTAILLNLLCGRCVEQGCRLQGIVSMRSSPRRTGYTTCFLAFAIAVASCARPGQYIWFQRLPQETVLTSNEYIIGVGDVISIHVFGREEMTARQRVRSDGRVSLSLVGDVDVKGKRPSALKAELEARLKDYIVSPNVVVNVEETQPVVVLLFGEVAHVGVVSLDQDTRLAHAMALAGGLSDFASKDSIFIVRSEPRPVRIRFQYEDIYRNIGGAGDFRLRRGDIVEVE
jgi:polysaccharide biosynthesis/export protein